MQAKTVAQFYFGGLSTSQVLDRHSIEMVLLGLSTNFDYFRT